MSGDMESGKQTLIDNDNEYESFPCQNLLSNTSVWSKSSDSSHCKTSSLLPDCNLSMIWRRVISYGNEVRRGPRVRNRIYILKKYKNNFHMSSKKSNH